jgi:hypothetical protein
MKNDIMSPPVTTYTATLTNGVKTIQVVFDSTGEEIGLLIADALFTASEEDMKPFGEQDRVWVEEIRNTLTWHLLYFVDNLRMPEDMHDAPRAGDPCVTA